MANFISSTVAAVILLPLVAAVGQDLVSTCKPARVLSFVLWSWCNGHVFCLPLAVVRVWLCSASCCWDLRATRSC